VPADGLDGEVVGVAAQPYGVRRVERLRSRWGEGQDLPFTAPVRAWEFQCSSIAISSIGLPPDLAQRWCVRTCRA